MSYYSDLKFTTSATGFNKLKEMFKEYNVDLEKRIKIDTRTPDKYYNPTYMLTMYDINHIETSDEHRVIDKFMSYADLNHIPYSYAKIGETLEDVEIENNWSDGDYDIARVEVLRHFNEY